MKKLIFILAISISISAVQAQMLGKNQVNSRADSLRGTLTPLRTCYDINYYHLDVKIDIDQKSVSGSNEFAFTATQDFTKLQFDLFDNLKVDKVVYKGTDLPFTREYNAVFIKRFKILCISSKFDLLLNKRSSKSVIVVRR